jgi:Phage protein (N4 Gp49/phage Sf6 gene 66) family
MKPEEIETKSSANATAPRVTLDYMRSQIRECYYLSAAKMVSRSIDEQTGVRHWFPDDHPLQAMTVCVCVLENGFIIIGHSTPASPENFNADLGKELAYDQCIKQMWPLFGFALKEQIRHNELPPGGVDDRDR